MVSDPKVIIIGGGLAGLCCARSLHQAKISFLLLEASDRVGGRVRTDNVDGFLLDRGFQVLLPAYPEARQVLDYEALDLCAYDSGALVWENDKFERIKDPWRHPVEGIKSAFSPIGSLADKLKLGALRQTLLTENVEALLKKSSEIATAQYLLEKGFSEKFIQQFFSPFYGGVFLEPNLTTSSRMFEFTFRMFAEGGAAIPRYGMESIAKQLAANLPQKAIRCHARVKTLSQDQIQLDTGEVLTAPHVVLATDAKAAHRLFGVVPELPVNGTVCFQYAAKEPPVTDPLLVLNGQGVNSGPINNVAVPSNVSSAYAPTGQALVTASVIQQGLPDIKQLEASGLKQLHRWFGKEVDDWKLLASQYIPEALLRYAPGATKPLSRYLDGKLVVCGDYMETPSIQGAMVSGRKAAEMVLETMR
ncbi:MAG: FAD-dependent oxidoreductase [Vampirovibrio sp.]|nr:FAD-dependent oxidoreductase [Vampirovibrio sp.]